MDTFFTIQAQAEGLYKEKGSRFIALAYPIRTVDEAKTLVQQLRKQYHDARHVCYAYSVGEEMPETRSNDDGEPSGTAGRPILGAIQSNRLTNVFVAVVRYFGGVKLGTSGLITAYRAAAADALANAEIVEETIDVEYLISFEYPLLNDVMRVMKDNDCEILEQDFELTCRLRFRVRKGDSEQVENKLKQFGNLII